MKWQGDRPMQAASRNRNGFTLIEMMVTISIIGLLIALLVPVVNRVRNNARDTQCRSNLRQLSQGLLQRSSSHPSGEYCSGAWDWKRDGAVSEVGWVADLVAQGISPGDMLCPSSPNLASRVFEELLTQDGAANLCADSLGGPDRTLPDGSVQKNPCRQLVTAADKGQVIQDLLVMKGFHTNYATSWFLVRTDVTINQFGQLVNKKSDCSTSQRERSCTIGPLVTSRVGRIAANTIPIMGCGNSAETDAVVLSQKIGDLEQGTLLADSYTYGPRDKTTLGVPTVTTTGAGGATSWFGPWNDTLQDYRAFGPVHGFGRKGSCNIAFLDGTVKPYLDENGDGLLNNGFPASTVSGFADDVVELPPAEVHSRWSMDSVRLR